MGCPRREPGFVGSEGQACLGRTDRPAHGAGGAGKIGLVSPLRPARKQFKNSFVWLKLFSVARVYHGEPMNAAIAIPEASSLDQARAVIVSLHGQLQQALWRVGQLEKELYGPSSERQAEARLSKEQILLSLFPPAEPAATQQVLVRLDEKPVVWLEIICRWTRRRCG
jgi:hypothetical protein